MDGSFKQKTLTDRQLQLLLDRLDQQDSATRARDKRQNARLHFRHTRVPIRITQPGGGTNDLHVATRDLSSTGVSFLYWSFLHTGTEVRVSLKRRMTGTDVINGEVAWCRHVTGPHHLVGVRFNQKIFAKLYLDPAGCEALDGEARVDPKALKGRLLSVDDEPMVQKLLKYHLRETAIELTQVDSAASALAAVKDTAFDLILLDLNLGREKGEDLVVQFRSAGFAKPIIVVTGESQTPRLATAQQNGVTTVIQKPYDPAKLLGVIGMWIGGGGEGVGEDAIYSQLPEDDAVGALIQQYVSSVTQSLQALQAAISANQIDQVRTVCQSLKGSGSGFGFPTLSDAAKEAVTTLDASRSIAESATELQRLESIGRRLAVRPVAAAA